MPQENLTTIREDFEKAPLLHLSQTNGDSSLWVLKSEVADWFLTKFSHLLQERDKELVEKIKNVKRSTLKPELKEHKNKTIKKLAYRLEDAETAYNRAVDDVLALITSNK